LEEDAPAVLGRQHRPLAERRVRGADRALDVGAGTVRDLRDDRAVGGILHIEGGAAVGVHPLAVDVHPLDVGHGDPPCWRIVATSPREPTPAEDSMLDAARHSTWGPRNGPQAPNARKRPGTAVALLDFGVAPVRWTVNCFRDRHRALSEGGTEVASPVTIVDPEGTVRSLVPRDRS